MDSMSIFNSLKDNFSDCKKIVSTDNKEIYDSSKYKIIATTEFDYLIIGSGLYGAVFAQQAKAAGKSVLVIDKRPNIAGNVYTEKIEGINVHKYGAHIFHTNNKEVWEYVNKFAEFNRFTNSPVRPFK